MTEQTASSRVHWVASNVSDQSRVVGISLLAIAIWAVGVPMAFLASAHESEAAGVGLFVASCSLGLALWIITFTTVDRFRALSKSLPEDISDTTWSRHFQSNPWFAFAFAFTAVHIGILVGHGIVLLG